MSTLLDPETLSVWPRTPQERYRIAVLRNDQPCWIASCGDPEALGLALVVLDEEGQFDHEVVGVFDVGDNPEKSGHWIINPWRRKR